MISLDRLMSNCPYVADLFNRLKDAVYLCDENGAMLWINNVAEKLDGYSREEIYGKRIEEVYGLTGDASPMLKALNRKEMVDEQIFRYVANGREIIQICNAGPLWSEGKVIGAYTIQSDVTNLKEILDRYITLQQHVFEDHDQTLKVEGFENLVGDDPQFLQCKAMALQAARSDSYVMIVGRTGSGKEMFARCIHDNSDRKDGPFIAINCAAIPESLLESLLFGTEKGIYTGAVERQGLFEQAAGGTLFLDEINSMPLESQSKLLRVLEERVVRHLGSNDEIKINVRIISSSNTMPREAIENGEIREDLFYRLSVINIIIPDLVERKGDVFLLANHFIAYYNERFHKHIMGLDDEVTRFFLDFSWPGNVRQLKHCIESAMNFVGNEDYTIQMRHLPHYLFDGDSLNERYTPYHMGYGKNTSEETMTSRSKSNISKEENVYDIIRNREKSQIIDALLETSGNVTRAAKVLGISRQSLIYRMKKYNIKKS